MVPIVDGSFSCNIGLGHAIASQKLKNRLTFDTSRTVERNSWLRYRKKTALKQFLFREKKLTYKKKEC